MKMDNKKNKVDTSQKESHSTFRKNLIHSYKTSDLYLSAFLKSKGVILHNIERRDNKVFFVFQDEGDIPDLVNKYFNNSSVEVLSFKAALTDLRSIIFDNTGMGQD